MGIRNRDISEICPFLGNRQHKPPVLLTDGVTTIDQTEVLSVEGCADLIGVGRDILKNAHWIGETVHCDENGYLPARFAGRYQFSIFSGF